VLSPSDRSVEVEARIQDDRNAGVRLIWAVNPSARTVTEYGSRKRVRVPTDADTLDGQDAAPGCSARVAEQFE